MSDVAEEEGSGSESSTVSHNSKFSRQLIRRRERKSPRFLTVTGGIRTPHFGSLSRKRAKSAERQNKSKSESDAQVNQLAAKIEEDFCPFTSHLLEVGGKDTPRPDSGYCDGMTPSIRGCDDGPQYSRKASVQSQNSLECFLSDQERYTRKAESKLQELITTEQTYVQNLTEIVDGYLKYMETSLELDKPDNMVQMPADLRNRHKYRIVYGNIRDIFEYHKKTILPEMEKAISDIIILQDLFSNRQDSLKTKYGRFCLNKPKSEYIITEHSEYFTLIRMAKNFQHNLNSHLMTPIQRVTRYPLLLQDIGRLYAKAGDLEKREIVMKAYETANEVAEYANNMMTAGRIGGFAGDVTRQGLLLMCGDAVCYKRRHALKKPKMRNCQVFVFQESIIVCEKDEQTMYLGASVSNYRPQLNYWTSFQINKVHVREVNRGPDYTPRFELERRDDGRRDVLRTDELPGKSAKPEVAWIVVQCESELKRNQWLKVINDQIKELQTLALNLSKPPKTNK